MLIARRELSGFFDTLTAYILLVLFLGFSGFFTWAYGNDIFLRNQADLAVFFGIAYWSLFFFIPAITMRTLAEENKSGTIELLLTKAVTDWQIVLGKFLGSLGLILVALLLTTPFYFSVWNLGPVDHGSVIAGYFGLVLMAASYISIGLFASSITQNQIVAFLLSMLIGIFFHIVFDVLRSGLTGWAGSLFDYLSLSTHYESISRGVVDSRDLVYFFSLITAGLVLAETSLAKRNLSES